MKNKNEMRLAAPEKRIHKKEGHVHNTLMLSHFRVLSTLLKKEQNPKNATLEWTNGIQ